jgi:uncharacterized membrane protein
MSVMVRRPSRAVTPVRRGLGLTGSGVAGVFFCLSLTPSLLPRGWLLQGVVGGLSAAMGYALGALAGALLRLFWLPSRRTRATATAALLTALPLAFALFLWLGARWQRALRARLGIAPLETYDGMAVVVTAALTFGALLALARGLRLATRGLAALLARVTPRPLASPVAVLVVALLAGVVGDRVVAGGTLAVAGRTAAVIDRGTDDGAAAPRTTLRSGGPFSLVGWDSLGRQGRDFVGTGPGRAQLEAFAGRPAREPVRVYAGLGSAATTGERVRLIMAELDRTGAFDREVIAVLIPTGTGWVGSDVTDSLEYMYAGDTALVSLQYSSLPSWISFLADREQAVEAARALIGAVRERWSARPPEDRPRLLVFGESLGTLGVEKAFGSAAAMTAGADGVLLEGPTFANPVRDSLVEGRRPGTPVWDPVPEGFPVEFADRAEELRRPDQPGPRVVYLQNSSDPVVWWSPGLLVREPPWLRGPRGPDVPPQMRWIPGVTFWQTAADLVVAKSVTPGHGHVYASAAVEGWAALAPPPGWQVADTIRLRALLDSL